MKWWLSRRVDEHFIFLSLSLLKKKSKKYFSLKYKYCLLSFCAQILYFVYIYILQLTIETNSPQRNLPFLLLMRSFPRSPPMRSTMAQSLTTLGDGTDCLVLDSAFEQVLLLIFYSEAVYLNDNIDIISIISILSHHGIFKH